MDIEFQGPKYVTDSLLFTNSILKGLKELTEFGYVTQVPVQLLTIPRNPRNIVDLNMLSDEEEGDDDVLLFFVCFKFKNDCFE